MNLLVLLLHFVVVCEGLNNWFVSPSGNDNWDGSESNPFATLSRAMATISPCDVINVMDGTYSGPENLINIDECVTITSIDGSGKAIFENSLQLSLTISSKSVTLIGLIFLNGSPNGLVVNQNSSAIIELCVFQQNSIGIRSSGETSVINSIITSSEMGILVLDGSTNIVGSIISNNDVGVHCTSSTVALTTTEVAYSGSNGISLNSCSMSLIQSRILANGKNNTGGGIELMHSSAVIQSSEMSKNMGSDGGGFFL